jgi:hypothetical protein
MAADGRITLHPTTIEGELADSHLRGGTANLEDVRRIGVTNERSGWGREVEWLHQMKGVSLDLRQGGEVVGLRFLGEIIHGTFGLKVKAHAGLEGLVTRHSEEAVSGFGRFAELRKG